MKYMGSKTKIAKEILPVILSGRKPGQFYVEPFVGGANSFYLVDGPKIGGDNNPYLIEMWKGLQRGEERPRKITKELYSKARSQYNKEEDFGFSDFLVGWIGWMASFNGRFFDGGYSGHNIKGRDYISEQIKNTERQAERLKDSVFTRSSYQELEIPSQSIIYCDIPYYGTKQYSSSKDFSHEEFWCWARQKSKEGHELFVSEYQAPEDFQCVWQKEIKNFLKPGMAYKRTERLFKTITCGVRI